MKLPGVGMTALDMQSASGPFFSSGCSAAHVDANEAPRMMLSFCAMSWFVSCTATCGFEAASST